MAEFSLILVAICAIVMLRNCVTYTIRRKALMRVSDLAQRDINAGRADWDRHYDRYERPSYEGIMFNPLIWTARQAYPWLFDGGDGDGKRTP